MCTFSGWSHRAGHSKIAWEEFVAGRQADLATGAVAARVATENYSVAGFHFGDASTNLLDNPSTFVAENNWLRHRHDV